MQKIKIFKGIEGDTGLLEQEINSWISENNIKVIQMTGNIAPQSSGEARQTGTARFALSDVIVILLYEAA